MSTLTKQNNSVIEFITSFLGIKSAKIFLVASGTVLMTGFIPYFEKHLYFNFLCFMLFNVSMAFDIFSAILLAKIRGGGFETNKAMKAVAKLIGYNYLLYLSYQLDKFFKNTSASEDIYNGLSNLIGEGFADGIQTVFGEYNLTPYMVFLYAFIIISFSALKNFQLADVFRNVARFDRWIYKHVDLYKNRPSDRLWSLMNDEQKRKIGYDENDKPLKKNVGSSEEE